MEVLGALFLAVEAIKLHNVRFLRDRVLKMNLRRLNPEITFVDGNADNDKGKTDELRLYAFLIFFVILGMAISCGVLYGLGVELEDAWKTFSRIVPGSQWVDVILAVPVALVGLIISIVIGLSAYTIVVLSIRTGIAALDFIEQHTSSGVIGIIGFLFFLIGAALKSYLDWQGI